MRHSRRLCLELHRRKLPFTQTTPLDLGIPASARKALHTAMATMFDRLVLKHER